MEHSLLVNVHKEFWLLYFRASHAKAFPFSKKGFSPGHWRSLKVIYFCLWLIFVAFCWNKPLFIVFIDVEMNNLMNINTLKNSPSLVTLWDEDVTGVGFVVYYLSLLFFSVVYQKKNPILLFNILRGSIVQYTKHLQIRTWLQLKSCIWNWVNVKLFL